MIRASSKPVPASLRAAFELDKQHALKRRRLSIERLAELMGSTPATLYKWLEAETMPANRLPAWEHLTGSDEVVRYLAASAHRVVIEIPCGRDIDAHDVHALQAGLNAAVGALIGFMRGEAGRDECLGLLGHALESLAWHRENVARSDQPELEFD